jgi:hypothetical protein
MTTTIGSVTRVDFPIRMQLVCVRVPVVCNTLGTRAIGKGEMNRAYKSICTPLETP